MTNYKDTFSGAEQRDSYLKHGSSIADSARDSVTGKSAGTVGVGNVISAFGFLHSGQRDRLEMSRLAGITANSSFSANSQRASYITHGGSIDRLAAVSPNRVNKGSTSIFAAASTFPHQGQRAQLDLARIVVGPQATATAKLIK